MRKRAVLDGLKKQVWQSYFNHHDYREVMCLRAAYNDGYRTDGTRKATAIYIAFRRKLAQEKALANA